MVQPNDRVKILDFGLACPPGTEDFSDKGTPYYMAPEQIDGGPVDPRTDIYALGVTAFEMATGRRPFPEDNLKELLDWHLTRDIMDPMEFNPAIPQQLRRFILKCTRCDPNQRYQDMNQALAALNPLMQDFRLTDASFATGKGKMASIFLRYTDENQPELTRLVEAFKAQARELGAEVD
jgi:serine/threonine protein kinase